MFFIFRSSCALASTQCLLVQNIESLEAQLNDALSDRSKAAESISSLQVSSMIMSLFHTWCVSRWGKKTLFLSWKLCSMSWLKDCWFPNFDDLFIYSCLWLAILLSSFF